MLFFLNYQHTSLLLFNILYVDYDKSQMTTLTHNLQLLTL